MVLSLTKPGHLPQSMKLILTCLVHFSDVVKSRWFVEVEKALVTISIIADKSVTHVTICVTHVMIYVNVSTCDSVTNLIIVGMNVTRVTTTERDVWTTDLIDREQVMRQLVEKSMTCYL